MYSFQDDYSEWAHVRILDALKKWNMDQQYWYGKDAYCLEAEKLLRKKIQNAKASVHFVSWGTQANLLVIWAILKSFESVIAAKTSHINVHEAGAIELTGHKIDLVDNKEGKVTPDGIQMILDTYMEDHTVKPRLVFISNSTEIGTIYRKHELIDLHNFCKKKWLFLYLDGARIGSALSSRDNDLTLADLWRLVDIFYIWWTKNGALLGEAIVINNDVLKEDFRSYMKQRWALLAKGRILGIQFTELFKDNLFFDLAKHANAMAYKLADAIQKMWYDFFIPTMSNQLFPIFPNKIIELMLKKYAFYVWTKIDNKHSAIRLVTSWATDEKMVDAFISDVKKLKF